MSSSQQGQANYVNYKPQAPAYTPYHTPKSQTNTIATSRASTTGSYLASSTPSAAVVGYPAYSQSSYASAANAYYKHLKESKNNAASQVTGSYNVSSQQNLTPVQQQVVQQYIHQKTQGTGQTYTKKKVYMPPQNPQTYYCEVCKISCASALVS